MEAYVVEWLHLGLRWFHVVTAITWVGSSFYFNRIDRSFRPPEPPVDRVSGQLWSIHGGAIYNYSRFPIGPGFIPARLKWSKWESFGTWMSGAGLLAVVYWWGASVNLVSGAEGALKPASAVTASIASIVIGWMIYDVLCRTIPSDRVLTGVVAILLSASAWGFTHLFSGKAALLHTGIIMATIMAGNVWFVILPGQKQMLKAMADGSIDRFDVGAYAKRRNYHNNYLTLPVVFSMIAAHFPFVYGHPLAWLGFILISAAGVAIRHFFNTMHAGAARPRWITVSAVFAAAAIILLAPKSLTAPNGGQQGADAVDLVEVERVLATHCGVCHSREPSMDGFIEAPKGIVLDTPGRAALHAAMIRQLAVDSEVMPPANITEMTKAERDALAQWIRNGAPTD